MLSDCHVHTEFSGDSKTPLDQQIEAAIRLGMEEICITDHHDYGCAGMTHIDYTLDIPSYLPAVREAAEKYRGKIRVLTGIELGLMMREKDYLIRLEKELPVDYIIGSSHFIDAFDVYDKAYYEGRSERASYLRYFESTLTRVSSMDCFDSLGHLDYIVRYGPNKNSNYRPADYMDIIDQILKILIDRQKGLECNTAGFKYGLGHPNPQEEILIRYRELGGELLTVGSDGHSPNQVGLCFPQIQEFLKQCGFRYYTVFCQRKPEFRRL